MKTTVAGDPVERVYSLSREDTSLVAGLRRGDQASCETLVAQHDPTMRRVASNYVADPDTARDIVQETWMIVLQGIHRFEGRSSLKTWIYAILINRARTRGVKESRTIPYSSLEAPERGPSDTGQLQRLTHKPGRTRRPTTSATHPKQPHESAEDAEMMTVISQCIAELPAGQRAVIILRDIYGCRSTEVCERLDLSPANQRVLLHRARLTLRKALLPYLSSTGAPTT